MWFLCTNTVSYSHIDVVCKLYSQVFVVAVGGSECPEVIDDCPATVSGQALDAYLPRLGPYRDLQVFHYVKHTWEANQCPQPHKQKMASCISVAGGSV